MVCRVNDLSNVMTLADWLAAVLFLVDFQKLAIGISQICRPASFVVARWNLD